MTKDKIREGLAWEMALKNGAVAEGQLEWRESTRFFWLHQADIALEHLDSVGCVLKVERELPPPKDPKYLMWQEDEILEAIYAATERLV
ncbi:hypothetical protein LCGC14_0370250 [marine sediment metagenome]|uniref:Uncharacterized protein n=1 Tax=marine sediment metagenome TaxID=412755 RepID=A0A0F9VSS2_9ZZZZ